MCMFVLCVWLRTVASRGQGGFRAGERKIMVFSFYWGGLVGLHVTHCVCIRVCVCVSGWGSWTISDSHRHTHRVMFCFHHFGGHCIDLHSFPGRLPSNNFPAPDPDQDFMLKFIE